MTYDRWNKEPLLLSSVSQLSHPLQTHESPRSAEKHLYTVFQAQAFHLTSLLSVVLHSFPFLCSTDGVHFETFCLLPLEEAGRSAIRTLADSCLCCIPHTPSSLLYTPPSLLLFLFPFSRQHYLKCGWLIFSVSILVLIVRDLLQKVLSQLWLPLLLSVPWRTEL